MCIIIVKPAGVRMPSEFVRYKCELTNPDGFGFATDHKLFHSLNRKQFEEVLRREVTDADPCIIHCRIATHGSIKKANCHPFLDKNLGVAFAHNGMLDIKPKNDMTDSETVFRGYFVPVIRQYGYDSRELAAAVRDVIGYSKFAFINREGQIQMFGNWIKDAEGCYYSHPIWHF